MKRSKPLRRTELARGTKRLPPRSARRDAEAEQRAEVRAVVLARAGNRCQWAEVVPWVRCGWLPGRRQLEVDELRGGSYRSTEYLDPDRCRAACPRHHDYKTAHKREALALLDEYERTHG